MDPLSFRLEQWWSKYGPHLASRQV